MAAVTTLIVEYLAKPWLEVRKDRILEKGKERRTAIKNLKRSAFQAGRLLGFKDRTDVPSMRERAHKIAEDIEPLLTGVYEVMGVAEVIQKEWTETTAIVVGFSSLFLAAENTPEESWNQFDKAADLLDVFSELFTVPNWQVARKRDLIQKIKKDSPLLRTVDPETAPGD